MVPRHTPGISWWAAYTTHMLRVSLVYILIYGSILEIHEYLKHFVRTNLSNQQGFLAEVV